MSSTLHPLALFASTLWLAAAATGLYHVVPVWDRLARQRMGDSIQESIRIGMSEAVIRHGLRIWGIGLVTVATACILIVQSLPIAIVFVWLTFLAPRVLLVAWNKYRRRVLRDQMVGAAVGLANAARAGLALKEGIASVTPDTSMPLKKELHKIVSMYECGFDLGKAIDDVASRLQLESFSLMAAALKTTLEGGGNLSEAMERISKSLQEHQRLERTMESNTASARRAASIMALFPLVFIGIMYGMDADATGLLFTTFFGQIVLSVVIGLIYIGKRWIDRVTTVHI